MFSCVRSYTPHKEPEALKSTMTIARWRWSHIEFPKTDLEKKTIKRRGRTSRCDVWMLGRGDGLVRLCQFEVDRACPNSELGLGLLRVSSSLWWRVKEWLLVQWTYPHGKITTKCSSNVCRCSIMSHCAYNECIARSCLLVASSCVLCVGHIEILTNVPDVPKDYLRGPGTAEQCWHSAQLNPKIPRFSSNAKITRLMATC